MRFNEWLSKLDIQQKKVENSLGKVSETILINEHSVTIHLGKEYEAVIDGSSYRPKELRFLYTNNKEEFANLLEVLTHWVTEIAEATDFILEALTEEAVPGAVLARMTGAKEDTSSQQLLSRMCEKKLKELWDLFHKQVPDTLESFSYRTSVVNSFLVLEYKKRKEVTLYFGAMSCHGFGVDIPGSCGLKEQTGFLAAYELIKARILRFCLELKGISKEDK